MATIQGRFLGARQQSLYISRLEVGESLDQRHLLASGVRPVVQ